MNRIPVRVKIVLGLQLLLISALGLAIALGLVPSDQPATLRGRALLSESIAVDASAFVSRNDMLDLDAVLRAQAARNPDIVSLGIRKSNGFLVIDINHHDQHWKQSAAATADSHVLVPVFSQDKQWGTVEIDFRPVSQGGWRGMLTSPYVKLIGFVSVACLISFLAYLKRMLQHLDPSKVVPPHVRAALDTLAEGLLILDQEGRIAMANQAFAHVRGVDPEKLMGTQASRLEWEQDTPTQSGAEPIEHPWTQAIRTNQPQRNRTLHLKDAGGVRRTFIVNCSPVAGARGKARGALASFEDITPLVEKEIELRKSKEAADDANRAKSDFLARMSHEIRTPMNAILGFTDILRRGYEENESERQEFLSTIHSSGQHLLELINDILDLSKIESGKMEIELTRCSPHQLVSEVVAILNVRAQAKGIDLSFAWDGPAPTTVLTDPTRLRQVITNLVGNSIKFTETGSVKLAPRLATSGDRAQLIIDVIDTGIGMKPDSLAKIFDPFTQADNSITRRFGGTGLGLSISRQCAKALGGGLSVKSEFGKGSTFTLFIDAGPAEAIQLVDPSKLDAHVDAAASTSAAVRLKPSRVLVVEDGVSNQKLVNIVLNRAGASVELANNGQIGVEKALAEKFDIILMDMQMPVMDGFTATRTLREAGCNLPIIALTANAMKGEEEKCKAAGCTGYLSKPINVDLLLRTVANHVGELPADAPTSQNAHGAAVGNYKPIYNPVPSPGHLPRLQSTLPTEDPDFLEIVQEFVDRLGERIGDMQKAWEHQELSQLAQLAHWLKGSGGTAGFNAFTNPAARLEKLAREKRTDEISAALADLQDLTRRVIRPPSKNDTANAEQKTA